MQKKSCFTKWKGDILPEFGIFDGQSYEHEKISPSLIFFHFVPPPATNIRHVSSVRIFHNFTGILADNN